MSAHKARRLILLLSALTLLVSLFVRQPILSALLIALCAAAALVILYRNLAALTPGVEEGPKMNTVRQVTVMNLIILLALVGLVVGMETGLIAMTARQEELFLIGLLVVLMVVFGNIAPKLPHSRHTGLRLPWTVADEETWIVAHRILGYISIPLALLTLAATPLTGDVGRLFMASILLWIAIPGGLSYVFYRKKFRGEL